MNEFSQLFERATGFRPYPYQHRLATQDKLPSLLSVPTGLGKTAASVLAWLWRRRYANEEIRSATPRRLIYCLPMRVLVEQTVREVNGWLDNLGLGDIELHMLLGGDVAKDWDLHPEHDAVIVGTQDMILSRALNRGYAMSPFRWPVQFGLLNNDALWILDEVQLMGSGLATSAQLQAFRRQLGTVSPCLSIWMSATMRSEWLRTVDFDDEKDAPDTLELHDADRDHENLHRRLTARKRIGKDPCAATPDAKAEAALIVRSHQAASRTLVVVNTVKRATSIYKAVAKLETNDTDVVLIHSRFRPRDREAALNRLLSPPTEAGTIAVSTQVVEAGVDVSAKTMFTDLAPWPSLVQRFGRCNRDGKLDDAAIIWFDMELDAKGKTAAPYSNEELSLARERLVGLDDASSASLPEVGTSTAPTHVIRRRDIVELFDTTPDLAGADIDVSRFIREADEHSVQVFWRDLGSLSPDPNEARPHRDELCAAPLGEVRDFLKKNRAWRWDHLEKAWTEVGSVFPGLVMMLCADDGGYAADSGWTEKSKKAVAVVDAESAAGTAYDDDHRAKRPWLSLSEHTGLVVDELERVLAALPDVDDEHKESLRLAARWHDAGKAHEVFQAATIADDDGGGDAQVWGKAPRMERYSRPGFRHEFASALAMLRHGLPDLAVYLAAAHHGKVRLSIRSLPHEKAPGDSRRRFARGVWDGDVLAACDLGDGVQLPETELDLEYMELGDGANGPSWLARTLALRDAPSIGPFRLAYLEALLRVADWHASATKEVKRA